MATRLAIVNPASAGGRTARRWQQVVADLRQQGVQLEVRCTDHPMHAAQLASRFVHDGGRELVVLGGDGTLNEVVAGCVRPDGSGMSADGLTISVVHQGTGGDLARGLGIPRDEQGAIDTAASRNTRAVDVGVAQFTTADGSTETRGWLVCSNVGMGADVAANVTGTMKRLGDSAAFALATVATLARNPERRVRLWLDDGEARELAITEITAANNRFMGGGMLVAPDARIDDGELDVVIIAQAPRWQLLRTFPKIYTGSHVHHPLVRVERAKTLRVEALGEPQGVVLDGELVGVTPAEFRLLPQALLVRVP